MSSSSLLAPSWRTSRISLSSLSLSLPLSFLSPCLLYPSTYFANTTISEENISAYAILLAQTCQADNSRSTRSHTTLGSYEQPGQKQFFPDLINSRLKNIYITFLTFLEGWLTENSCVKESTVVNMTTHTVPILAKAISLPCIIFLLYCALPQPLPSYLSSVCHA